MVTAVNEMASILLGASRSVSILAPCPSALLDFGLDNIIPIVDSRLDLRCLLCVSPDANSDTDSELGYVLNTLIRHDWNARSVHCKTDTLCVIIDTSSVTIAWHPPDGRLSLDVVEGQRAHAIWQFFIRTWRQGSTSEILYEDLLRSSVLDVEKKILTVSKKQWDDLIKRIARSPSDLFSLSSRDFEELVAELLSKEGMHAMVTPRTRDGGVDILAFNETILGRHLFLVECKKYGSSRRVGATLVRALYGEVEKRRATAGLLITTSSFTKPAIKYAKDVSHRLSLADFEVLIKWIIKLRGQSN